MASHVVLRGLAAWQIRHQGPSVQELTVDWENHDRFIAPSYTTLGLGASVPIRGVDIYALWLGTVQGSNGAHRARTIAAGVTFAFGSRLTGLGSPSAKAPEVPRPSGDRFRRH